MSYEKLIEELYDTVILIGVIARSYANKDHELINMPKYSFKSSSKDAMPIVKEISKTHKIFRLGLTDDVLMNKIFKRLNHIAPEKEYIHNVRVNGNLSEDTLKRLRDIGYETTCASTV